MARQPHEHDAAGCRDLLTRMARGVDGDLSAAERRALLRHLAGCERCGAFSESLKQTIALCRAAGAPAMSAKARARARANVRRLVSRPTRSITRTTKVTKKHIGKP
jgi:anti-sigma factor RsiW